MYHRKKGRRLGRRPDHRKAMLRNLAISLIEEERIETTVTRAKEVRRLAERLVTYAKRGDLHGRRLIVQRLGNNPDAAEKLVDDIAPRYEKRAGGYTRVLKTGFRRGDAAPTALIEWVEQELPKRKKKSRRKAESAESGTEKNPVEETPSEESLAKDADVEQPDAEPSSNAVADTDASAEEEQAAAEPEAEVAKSVPDADSIDAGDEPASETTDDTES